ncbi:MAG: DUF1549 domain-containing protein [Planctomycetota bacterium]|nr:DUF1549 domain-containing protein [Planctomycetota bacterium]
MMKPFVFIFSLLLLFIIPIDVDAKPRTSVKKEEAISKRIDVIINKRLREAGFTPSPRANELVILRRLSLDLTGVIPQPESVINYRKLRSKKKLNVLIEKLINSPRFADHMADQLIRSWIGWNRGQSYQYFKDWLVEQILAKRPLNAIVQDVLNPKGTTLGPKILFSLSQGQRTVVASESARAFMGLQIGCAQCHDHPFSNWKQQEFHEFAAFFARGDHVYETKNGIQSFRPRFPFKLGMKTKPTLPRIGTRNTVEHQAKKLELISKLITHPKNPYFSKSIVNHLWKSFMGRGLVEPVDDLEQAAGPNADVLAVLAQQFTQSGYDLRTLVRIIVKLEVYQRSSVQVPSEKDPVLRLEQAKVSNDSEKIEEALARLQYSQTLHQRGRLRLLSPQQIVSSILRASGIEPTFKVNRRGSQGDFATYKLLKRQMILRFEKLYDDKSPVPDVFEGSVRQKLVLFNDSFINDAMKATTGSMLRLIIKGGRNRSERIRALYIATLGRKPTKDELETCQKIVGGSRDRVQAYEDLMWALMNSSEFLMNH